MNTDLPAPEYIKAQLKPPVAPVTDEDVDDGLDEVFERKLFHRSCYLAGPMRGIEDYNAPAFNSAAADLKSRGWKVYNPMDLGTEQGEDASSYLAVELPWILTEADAIVCLPGWEDSEGANLEVACARLKGLPVLAYGEELSEIPVAAPPVLLEYDPHEIDVYIEEMHSKQESVCEEADRLVSFDRNDDYGHPLDDFSKITGAAQALGLDPTAGPEFHALYMVLVKLSRLMNTPGHHDSIVDGCGYLKTYDMVLKERERRAAGD